MATPYDDVILDHIKNARNFQVLEGASREISGSNPLCGDEFTLYIEVDGGTIADIGFQCTCCGLSMASASVMTECVKGKTKDEAAHRLQQFTARLSGTLHSNWTALDAGQRALLDAARRFPGRARCIALPWDTLAAGLAETE